MRITWLAEPSSLPQKDPMIGQAQLLATLGAALTRYPIAAIVPLLVLLSMARTGVGVIPNLDLWVEFARGFPDLPPVPVEDEYLLHSVSGVGLASLLGLTTRNGMILLHVSVILAGGTFVVLLLRRRVGDVSAVVAVTALVAAPVATTTSAWIGSYDAFTVIFASLLVASGSALLGVVAGCILAWTNFEQGLFICALLLFSRLRFDVAATRTLIGGVFGLVVGRIVLLDFLSARGVAGSRWGTIQSYGLSDFLGRNLDALPGSLATLLGAAIIIPAIDIITSTYRRRAAVWWSIVLLGALIPTAVSWDTTRVFALLTWPILLIGAIHLSQRLGRSGAESVAAQLLVVSLIVPATFVWYGGMYSAHWLF